VTKLIARVFLGITGWKPEGRRPAARRYVLIAAPHTSNWDMFFLLALATVFDVKISFMAKHQLFRGPMGWAMRKLGGIPVRRDRRHNLVDQMARELTERSDLGLVVPAEGTRGYVPHWKSGFYHIALTAQVPIVFGYLDYARKRGGFGPEMIPTGNVGEDMDVIRDFYSPISGKYPDAFGEIRLKEEM
jgi:1-acyl-sn-glycerol-3-phosphate acyltransferase